MSAENFMSLKYLFSKTKFNLVSFISRFSILVLIIAYFSFLTILSVFSGLEDYSISFSKSFDPDVKIEAKNGSYLFYNEKIDSILDGYNIGKVIKGNAVANQIIKANMLVLQLLLHSLLEPCIHQLKILDLYL